MVFLILEFLRSLGDLWELIGAIGLGETGNQDVLVHHFVLSLIKIHQNLTNRLIKLLPLPLFLKILQLPLLRNKDLIIQVLLLHIYDVDRFIQFLGKSLPDLVTLINKGKH